MAPRPRGARPPRRARPSPAGDGVPEPVDDALAARRPGRSRGRPGRRASRRGCSSGSGSASRCSATRTSSCSTSRRRRSIPVGRTDVRAIVRAARDRGATVILNSHLLTEVERVCDRVVILDHGRIIASGSLDEVVAVDGVRLRVTGLGERGPGGRRGLRPGRRVEGDVAHGPAARPPIGSRTSSPPWSRPAAGSMPSSRGAARSRRASSSCWPSRRECGVIVIARLTVKELVRRRVVWVLAILTVVSVALVGWGLDRLVTLARRGRLGRARDPDRRRRRSSILIAFMFSFVLAMTAAFVGAPAIGGDLESGRRLRDPRPAAPSRRPAARSLARARRSWSRLRGGVGAARHRRRGVRGGGTARPTRCWRSRSSSARPSCC